MPDVYIQLLDLVDELDKVGLTAAVPDIRTAIARVDEIEESTQGRTINVDATRARLAAAVVNGETSVDDAAAELADAVQRAATADATRDLLRAVRSKVLAGAMTTAKAIDWHATLDPAHAAIVADLQAALDQVSRGIASDVALRGPDKTRKAFLAAEQAVNKWHRVHALAAWLRKNSYWPIAPMSVLEWRHDEADINAWRWRDPMVLLGLPRTVAEVLDAIRDGAVPELVTPAKVVERGQRRHDRKADLWQQRLVAPGVQPTADLLRDSAWVGTPLAAPEDQAQLAHAG